MTRETNHSAEIRPLSRLQTPPTPAAPLARQIPHASTYHGQTLSDPYHWLKDPNYPKVEDDTILAYLKAENDYFRQYMAPHQALVDTLFAEFKGREHEQDSAVPWVKDGYEYRWYFKAGAEYRTWARKKLGSTEEVIILDEASEAEGKAYYQVSCVEVSPDGRYLAWGVDDNGAERFTIRIKDLITGNLLEDVIEQTAGEVAWSADSTTLLYTLLSEEWRPYLVKAHRLGTPVTADRELFQEQDPGYFVHIGKTHSGEFFVVHTGTHTISENHLIPADNPDATPVMMASRDKGFEYHVDHANGEFYVRANDTHCNFRLVAAPQSAPTEWQELIAASDSHYLTGHIAFKSFLAIVQKSDGLDQIRILRYDGHEHFVAFPEPLYAAGIGHNPAFDQTHLRLGYESMITPQTVFDYQPDTQTLITRKVRRIPSGYDKNHYVSERIWTTARDGAQIPVSLVYRKGFEKNGQHPMHLYGYGAYGMGIEPGFSTTALSLLDRGFCYAIAHIRGGDEMGYQWYLDGKLDKRTNTFNDFIDVANHLVEQQYVAKGNISIAGRSAGGELMGAATVQAPDLWRSVILGVPFVDVLNTMLDDTLPLTPLEWPEWGNPLTSAEAFDTIRTYSPYDNIAAVEYPPMLVTGGLNDPRVTYWEPAKWTARMRATKTDNNLLVMRMHMGAGHFSQSGRFARLMDYAEEFAFMLLAHGITE